jgi:two-component system phosphate regulon sensor histidine kinase PhoR
MRRDFVANVSHELKTPITSILGFADTLREGAADDKAARDRFLGILRKQAVRLQSLVEDLITLARVEHDGARNVLETRTTPLHDVLHAAAETCRAMADEKRMRLAVQCPEGLTVPMDPVLIEEAVSNLISNAIRYSEPDKPVTVEAQQEEGGVVVHVRDEGCGIEQKHLPRLFERFYRVDRGRSRQLGGTGLGLAIVKHVAEAHGGRVTVVSEPGKGSTFSLHLRAGRP